MIISQAKRALRGDLNAGTVALEALRRVRVRLGRRSEQALLSKLGRQPARFSKQFVRMSPAELLAHFRTRNSPHFFPGLTAIERTAALQHELFPTETVGLIRDAAKIADHHSWKLLGFGEKCFGSDIDWNLDPLSGAHWPRDYHADIELIRRDGSDVRVLWELNRLSHLITLGRAYALTKDEKFSQDFFRQVTSWQLQNPVGSTVNWNCAMEVALRAMNLLAAFQLFLRAPEMTEEACMRLLAMFDQHGAHIRRNLEFSHIATSNHYLCDVTSLLWLGTILPELEYAPEWRDFGLHELLNEMDKQVWSDGADYEASTGYHRLKVELFLFSFVLCHLNQVKIEEKYWKKLRAMIDYVRAYLRPDGRAPLIGDSDSGQALPLVPRSGDDHAYVLALGAALFKAPRFKLDRSSTPEELLWILGEQGVRDYEALPAGENVQSQAFPDAGTYVLRHGNLYLLLNASGSGVNGRGSHGHNDALSIEVSACGVPFIVDPGTYVYTADLHERHLFRSTAYHSTLAVDDVEQNSISEQWPFLIGDEAHPHVLEWQPGTDMDVVCGEHRGFQRLTGSITHQRRVVFNKQQRSWFVEDRLGGEGSHDLSFRFHFAPGLETKITGDGLVEARDHASGARLLIVARGPKLAQPLTAPELETQFCSRDYGSKEASKVVRWSVRDTLPFVACFSLVPVCGTEPEDERLKLAVNLHRKP